MQGAPGLTIEYCSQSWPFFAAAAPRWKSYLEVTIQRQTNWCHLKHVGYARCVKNEE
jgi:hypothetical protein